MEHRINLSSYDKGYRGRIIIRGNVKEIWSYSSLIAKFDGKSYEISSKWDYSQTTMRYTNDVIWQECKEARRFIAKNSRARNNYFRNLEKLGLL